MEDQAHKDTPPPLATMTGGAFPRIGPAPHMIRDLDAFGTGLSDHMAVLYDDYDRYRIGELPTTHRNYGRLQLMILSQPDIATFEARIAKFRRERALLQKEQALKQWEETLKQRERALTQREQALTDEISAPFENEAQSEPVSQDTAPAPAPASATAPAPRFPVFVRGRKNSAWTHLNSETHDTEETRQQ